MIPVKELRIGNYVNHKTEGLSRVTEIESHENQIGVTPLSFNNYVFMCAEIKPIPLTSEILEKCGFKKDKDGIYLFLNVLYWLDIGYLQIANQYMAILNAPCQYLHQLQNLIFALTGKELEYTP